MAGSNENELIRAAGGLVWRVGESGREVLLIHRARYDDWSLPKGKLKPGERWEQAALREVSEETGYRVRRAGFAGVSFYHVQGVPKVVLFWNMRLSGGMSDPADPVPGREEVDRRAWLTVEEALARLSYAGERGLLAQEAGA